MTKSTEYNYFLHYRRFHDMSPESMAKNIKSFQKLLKDIVPQDKHAKILDIGCATGEAVLALEELGYDNVQGIDIDHVLIDIAKEHNINVKLVDDTEVYLKELSQGFNSIILLDVLEHIPVSRQIQMVNAIYNALLPNGKLILTVPNAYSPVASAMRYGDFTHVCSFSPGSISFVLQSAGFEEIKITDLTSRANVKISWRFWRSYARKHYKELLARKIWRTMFEVFFSHEDSNFPMSANILVEATKNASCTS